MTDTYVPQKETGSWMNASNEAATRVGCNVCGWEAVDFYMDARQLWLDHQHDPTEDIKWRVEKHRENVQGPAGYVYAADVEYLLHLLEELEFAVTKPKPCVRCNGTKLQPKWLGCGCGQGTKHFVDCGTRPPMVECVVCKPKDVPCGHDWRVGAKEVDAEGTTAVWLYCALCDEAEKVIQR